MTTPPYRVRVHPVWLILALLSLAGHGRADPWPVEPTNQQGGITGTLGEGRGAIRFHQGTDIIGPNLKVYAVYAGTIDQIRTTDFDTALVRIGDMFYRHVETDMNVTDSIAAGQLFAMMRTDGPVHVHIERQGVNFLDHVLEPFQDLTAPVIAIGSYSFRREPTNFSNASTLLSAGDLYGKVDIVVEATDSRLNSSGGDAGPVVAPYQLKYRVLDAGGGQLDEVDYVTFLKPAPDASAAEAFGPGASSGHPIYVITNHPFETPYNRYWNTIQRDGLAEDWSGLPEKDARGNEEARFPDGNYTVYLAVRDVDSDMSFNMDDETIPVLLDNFKPYVVRVGIGAQLQYEAFWILDAAGSLGLVTLNTDFLGVASHPVTVEFSEPVQNPTLMIESFSGDVSVTSSQPADQQTQFTGTLEVPADDPSHDGVRLLTITATDLKGNDLDGHPATIAIRDPSSGSFMDPNDGGGMDQTHSIKIDATPPVTTIGP